MVNPLGDVDQARIQPGSGDVFATTECVMGTMPESTAQPEGEGLWRSRLIALVQALLLATVLLLVFWPRPAWGLPADGGHLFELHCAGCHPGGGNIIRRGRTLRLADLQRQGIDGPAAVARIAAIGIGRMDGYGAVLGEDGAEPLGAWVWEQALANWPRSPVPPVVEPADSAAVQG
jgi:cytochrome c6